MKRLAPAALLAVAATPAGAGEPAFVDVTRALGIDFVHRDGRSGEKYYIETSGAGAAWIDFDGDGDLDLFLVNGAATRGSALDVAPRDALYENRGSAFVDVAARAGVDDVGFGQGVCVGDVDGDGRPDMLVTHYGPDRLFRNLGDGRFEDVAAAAGVADERWGTSCAFGDLDGDGDLDLFVARYVNFSYENNPVCDDPASGVRSYCRPQAFDGLTDSLYVNRGDGTFVEEGAARGIEQEPAAEKGFGAVLSDLDLDGDLDIYVANDTTPNRLYVNDGTGRFEDWSLLAGASLSADGLALSGMGVDVGDADGDGRPDVLVTNYAMETHSLYRNLGALMFQEETFAAGLAEATWAPVGWGVQFFDYDNDGDLDVAVANGHVIEAEGLAGTGASYPQRNQLFRNDGAGRFEDVTDAAGEAWRAEQVSRGLAVVDYDDDGRLDLVITNVNDRVQLLRNTSEAGNAWLGIRLRGPAANPLAIGARVELTAGAAMQREVRSGASFLSQPDMRLHFGLGAHRGEVEAVVFWPDGHVQRARTAELDRYWTIERDAPPRD